MIPRIIHYVWVGPNRFPEDAQRIVDGWKSLNPSFSVILWDESNIDFSSRFIRQAYGARAYNRVSNYARMTALLNHGGIYLDHDVELIKPLDSLLENKCFAGFQTAKINSVDMVNNAVVGAIPNHQFIQSVISAMDKMNGAKNFGSGTGPGLFSKLLRKDCPLTPSNKISVVQDVTLYPPRYFYPYEWNEAFYPECITTDTIGLHRWAHTWKSDRRVFNALKRTSLSFLASHFPEPLYRISRHMNMTLKKRKSPSKSQSSVRDQIISP